MSDEFDLILSVVLIPGMSGIEFYQQAISMYETLARQFIFLTGAAPTEEQREFFQSSRRPVIQKPFQLDELRRAIRATFLIGEMGCLA